MFPSLVHAASSSLIQDCSIRLVSHACRPIKSERPITHAAQQFLPPNSLAITHAVPICLQPTAPAVNPPAVQKASSV